MSLKLVPFESLKPWIIGCGFLFAFYRSLQLDMRNLSLGRRHLVNAYEVEAGIGVIAGNTV